VEITRLLAQYEIIIHEHTCDDYVYQTEGQQEKLLEGKLVKMTTTVSSYHHKLEAYMVRIQQAYNLEVEMQSHIKMLTTKCGEMGATVSSLDKVRDAIHIIGVCPGIGKLTFVIPKWTGVYVKGTFDTVDLTDAEVDEAMNQLCEANAPNQSSTSVPVGIRIFYRSAETSELMLRSIEDLPTSNGADVPVMGTCPHCEGTLDEPDSVEAHASGHSRICWDPSAELNAVTKRRDCSEGRKAVVCVEDRDYGTPPVR
jgi:hypothetical protein